MPNFADQILGVDYQCSTDAINPGSDKSIYITTIANADPDTTTRTLTISSGDNIKVYRGQTITYDPPLKLAKGATATPGDADMLVAYFIAKERN
jgi:hypothetical protein